MFTEDDLIPMSALQHFLFCERQCALIHLERLWAENLFTAEGKVLHERVDDQHRERRKLHRTEYSMALRSLESGLVGIADVVEITLDARGGYHGLVPVEYKRGHDKESDVDRVQLCAQALCLEEMFGVTIPQGQFYYLQDHRRTSVEFDESLRATTRSVIEGARSLFQAGVTPPPRYSKQKCDRCSLTDLCMPQAVGHFSSVASYLQREIQRARHA